MDRRLFLGALGSIALSKLASPLPSVGEPGNRKGLVCTAFDFNGVQQCEAGIESSILDVVASDTQHATEWCWAACIQAVFAYYDHEVAQERVVKEVWGNIVNMPGYPAQILGALNRQWTDEEGNDFRASGATIGTNVVTAAQDLAADHPLIIGTRGHAMVLTSLTYLRDVYGRGEVTLAEVRDPWPLNAGHRALTPQEWMSVSFAARIRVTEG